MMLDNIKLEVSCINVNSFNLSTKVGIKKYVKIEGVTGKRADIILITDCRVGKNLTELEKLFRMSKNGNYKLIGNSKMETRGTCIAVREGAGLSVEEEVKCVNELYILLKLNKGGKTFVCGVVYGPNENNPQLFRELKEKLENMEYLFILGGGL
jgi:hypothetical protein